MIVTRRALLGAAAALSVPAFAATVAAPLTVRLLRPGKRDHTAAIDAIAIAARESLGVTGLPGMILALRGADGFAADLTLGWADLTARTPVGRDHLFEIGSISKSLVALTLWKLAAEGRIDLAAPVSRNLPAQVLPRESITTLQLLNHTAGLADFAPIAPPGGAWVGSKPGAAFSYSNTGYTLAGLLIDTVTGRPHADVIREQVLAPIGMIQARAHILNIDRGRFATGYAPIREDAAPLYGSPIAEGPWTEEDLGAGAVAATVGDLGAYLEYVIALGAGRGGPILSDGDAGRMLSPANTVADGANGYSNGFMRVKVGERPMLHHTGGMLMFTSAFHVDPAAGVGAFASVNGQMGNYRPRAVTAYAAQVLRAVAEGSTLPPPPDPRAARRIANPARYVGDWRAGDGATLAIRGGDLGLTISTAGQTGRLEQLGDSLATDLAGWDTSPLEFSTSGAGKDAAPDRLWVGDRLFGRDAAPPAPAADPPRLQALAGRYVPANPWLEPVRIVARDGGLVLLGYGPLVEDRRGFWRLADDKGGYERFRFDTMIAGKAHRLWWSGEPLARLA